MTIHEFNAYLGLSLEVRDGERQSFTYDEWQHRARVNRACYSLLTGDYDGNRLHSRTI